ncbi:MAG: flippase-like domain-containing protein [Gemmatimonadaceae bacterium]|nr:flippase-like domain-containing protein [Gemmatimonadaceae bacterium]
MLSTVLRVMQRPIVRLILLLATFAFIVLALRDQWSEVADAWATREFAWGWITLSTIIVLCTYAALIQSWRMLLSGWGGHLGYWTATRIWTIANLGRWLPGKVWSIGALGLMASQEGVSGVAAAGASILGTLLNLGAGLAVAVIFSADGLEAIAPGFRVVSILAAVGFVAGIVVLPRLLPVLLNAFARWRGLPLPAQHLTARQIWLATSINVFSWLAYGIAFALFAKGVTPRISSDPLLFIAVFSASYLVGFLALFSPGGLGFRELALGGMLVGLGMSGQGDAAILSATSRIWLTVLEVVPGIVGLFTLSPSQRAVLSRSHAPSEKVGR